MNAAKVALRIAMRSRLAAIGRADRERLASVAAGRAASLEGFRAAKLVLTFLSMPEEIDTVPLIEAALAAGKRVAVPRIAGDDIEFTELNGAWKDWPRDRWGIPEAPASARVVSVGEVASVASLALVPGLAFDARGGRLGRGKGYYDRWLALLAQTRAALDGAPFEAIGYGFQAQLLDDVPMDGHDARLDGLVLA